MPNDSLGTGAVLVPIEIWDMVFSHLPRSKQQLSELCLVCKHFQAFIQPSLFATIVLRPDPSYSPGDKYQTSVAVRKNALCIAQINFYAKLPLFRGRRELAILGSTSLECDFVDSIKQDSKLPRAMDKLIGSSVLLQSVTSIRFGKDIAIPFTLLEALCGVDNHVSPPLQRAALNYTILKITSAPLPRGHLRIRSLDIVDGAITSSQYSKYIQSLIHPEITQSLCIKLHTRGTWDHSSVDLFLGGKSDFTGLKDVHIIGIRRNSVPWLFIYHLLAQSPSVETATFCEVDENMMTACDRPLSLRCLHTVAAQVHVVRALIPRSPIRHLCLLGSQDSQNTGKTRLHKGIGNVNHANPIASNISRLALATPLSRLLTLFLYTYSIESKLLHTITACCPRLTSLDIRAPVPETRFNGLAVIIEALSASGSLPGAIECFTVHGIDFHRGDSEAVRDAVVSSSLLYPHLRHVDISSCNPRHLRSVRLNPMDLNAPISPVAVPKWVPSRL